MTTFASRRFKLAAADSQKDSAVPLKEAFRLGKCNQEVVVQDIHSTALTTLLPDYSSLPLEIWPMGSLSKRFSNARQHVLLASDRELVFECYKLYLRSRKRLLMYLDGTRRAAGLREMCRTA